MTTTEVCTLCLQALSEQPDAMKTWTSLCALQQRWRSVLALKEPPEKICGAIRLLEIAGYLLSTDHDDLLLILCAWSEEGIFCANPDEHLE